MKEASSHFLWSDKLYAGFSHQGRGSILNNEDEADVLFFLKGKAMDFGQFPSNTKTHISFL